MTNTEERIAKNLEVVLGDNYKVKTWTNIAIEGDTILATFRCQDDPKHYIMSLTKGGDACNIGELPQ